MTEQFCGVGIVNAVPTPIFFLAVSLEESTGRRLPSESIVFQRQFFGYRLIISPKVPLSMVATNFLDNHDLQPILQKENMSIFRSRLKCPPPEITIGDSITLGGCSE